MSLESDGRHVAIRVMMMPRDTNSYGTIFGGVIMSYIDQAAAIEIRPLTPHNIVTVAMDSVEFHQPVYVGDVCSFYTSLLKIGRTSMRVAVEVEAMRRKYPCETVKVTSAQLVFVAVDESGKPQPVNRSQ
jgi:acyl-CoA thioesterase YciA